MAESQSFIVVCLSKVGLSRVILLTTKFIIFADAMQKYFMEACSSNTISPVYIAQKKTYDSLKVARAYPNQLFLLWAISTKVDYSKNKLILR